MIGSSKKAVTYFSTNVVSSAQMGLTSLFGKVRGEPHRYNHLNFKWVVSSEKDLTIHASLFTAQLVLSKYLNIKEKGNIKKGIIRIHT